MMLTVLNVYLNTSLNINDIADKISGVDNWKKFTKQETDENCYDSMMRHIQAWRGGETHDVETGLPHMAHVMCNALFILWHALNGTK